MTTNQLMGFLLQYARMLASKCGVKVQIGGNTAMTDGNTVWVPALLEVTNPMLVKVMYVGYIVHEVAHIRFTDFEVFRQAPAFKRPFLNILEDVAIEKAMGEWLPGCRQSLKELVIKLRETERFGDPAGVSSLNGMLQAHCLYGLRTRILGHQVLADYAEYAAQALNQALPSGMVSKIDAILDDLPATKTTAERMVIVDRLFELLGDMNDENETSEPSQPDSSDDTSDADETPQSDGAQEDSGEAGQDQQDEESTDSGANADEAGQDEAKDENPDADGSTPAGSKAESEPGAGEENAEATPEQCSDEGASRCDAADKAIAEIMEPDTSFGAELGDLAKQGFEAEVVDVFDSRSAFDFASIARTASAQAKEAVHRVKSVSNGLAFRLRSLVESQTYCRKSLKQEGARIDRPSIHRCVTGDMRVFWHEKRSTGVNTAIYLLIDTSGSMSDRIEIARDTLLALTLALEQTQGVQVGAARYPHVVLDADRGEYSQGVEELVALGERVGPRSGVIESMTTAGGTPTAQALVFADAELAKAKADRKICFVLTDGEPDDPGALRQVLKGMQSEVIAIGIQTTSVGFYFDKHCTVNQLDELPTQTFKQLQQVLLGLG